MGYPAVAATLCVYGVFLAACGYYGAWSHEFAPKVMHSLYAGSVEGLPSASVESCAYLTTSAAAFSLLPILLKTCPIHTHGHLMLTWSRARI